MLLTGVPRVALDFGTRWERELAWLTVADALRGLEDGEFPAGSMGPKIESAGRFVEAGRGRAVITTAGRLAAAVDGEDGTWIVPRRRGRGAGVSWAVRVVRNRYVDSVRLMEVAQGVRARDGVRACEVLMGTPANLEALAARGATADAAPGDVVIAVDADDDGAAAALDGAERDLARLAAADADGSARPRCRARSPPPRGGSARANVALDLGAGRVRDARGAPRADRGHARLPVLRPRLARPTSSR